MICRNCGNEVPDGPFCGECGSRLDAPPASGGWVCENCGISYDDDIMFCGECGSPRSAASSGGFRPDIPSAPPEPASFSGGGWICENCGIRYDDDIVFCGECGAPKPLNPADVFRPDVPENGYTPPAMNRDTPPLSGWVCENCGIRYDDDILFCGECGASKPVAPAGGFQPDMPTVKYTPPSMPEAGGSDGGWVCENCGIRYDDDILFCGECGASKPVAPADEFRPDMPTAKYTPHAMPDKDVPLGGWICGRCGTKNDDGVLFCGECGSPNPSADRPVRPVSEIPKPDAPAAPAGADDIDRVPGDGTVLRTMKTTMRTSSAPADPAEIAAKEAGKRFWKKANDL